MTYRAAVIGCGRIGAQWDVEKRAPAPTTHAGAFAMHERTALAALVDPNAGRLRDAAATFTDARPFSTAAEMLAAVRPRVVSVATPPATHRGVVEACADADVPLIVCEKPIAASAADGRAMIAHCAARGTVLLVNHTRRFDAEIRRARDEVAAGAIGEVLQATAYYTNGIVNTGSHLLDLLRFLLGDVAWVTAVHNERSAAPPGDEGVDALVEFTSGARAALQCSDHRDHIAFEVHLRGRRGALSFTRAAFEIERTPLRPRRDVPGFFELDFETRAREGKPRSLMAGLVEHVVACLDGREVPLSRGEDGLAALELIEALRASAAGGGRRIRIDTREA